VVAGPATVDTDSDLHRGSLELPRS